ncbi:MAG: TRZ/ATZ family protein [Treponema sp.]|nr:TRZ/ATZ family protein [Treponema sp.]
MSIRTPLDDDTARSLRAGDEVRINGTVYAARDAAHARLLVLIREGKPLPFDLRGAVIYYVGPTPPAEGMVCGSAGPTTSGRMDGATPALLDLGLKGMIGKGFRSPEVIESMKRNGAVYFAAVGGAGALLARHIRALEVVAWPELGPESLKRLEVEEFPAIVAVDCRGRDLYREGPARYGRDPRGE